MTRPLVCPSCDERTRPTSASASDCGLPLVHATGRDAAEVRARPARPQGPPGLRRGAARARRLGAATRPRRRSIQGLLLEEGIPSLARRSGGFDVPDFLAAGPRDILVPSSGLDAAREMLGDRSQGRRLPEERHPAWMRALAVTLALIVFVTFAASVAVPFFD